MAVEAPIEITIPYEPNPKQALFHACGAEEVVYGGAKGGGKSCALVMEALAYGLEYPGAEIYLFRESYEQLEANLIKEWKEKVPKELYTYNESKHIALLYTDSRVCFRYVASKEDADNYNGRSIDFIGVDELTYHEEATIQILLSCCRSPKGFPPRFRGTCNPGGIGHAWVKKRYITATHYGAETIIDAETGNRIAFIPARVYDNEVLMRNDPAYVRRLENLPPARRAAYLEGDWDIYEGQIFEEFSERVHVISPFPIPPWWRRWLGNDPHHTGRFAWYWFAASPEGVIYVYREFARPDEDTPRLAYSAQAERVKELSTSKEEAEEDPETGELRPVVERLDFCVTGMDAWNRHPETGKAPVDYYHEGGLPCGCIRPLWGPGSRVQRAATLHEYLKWSEDDVDEETGRPRSKLKIFSTCRWLIETLPNLVADENEPEAVADCDIDHPYDALTYGLCAWHTRQSKAPEPEKSIVQKDKERLARRWGDRIRRARWS